MEINGGVQTVSLTVQPITEGGDTAFLVVFADVGPVRPWDEAGGREPLPEAENAVFQQVERELQETKQRLQATIEELETSNEELKSSNEELLSVNEELQSSNEELEASKEETQSINEELQTVNAELNLKVAELDQSNGDLRNIFESTRVGTIFLDRNLVIRSFTSAVTDIYNLVPNDRGRPLMDLVSRLDGHDVEQDIRGVFANQAPVERRVSANKGAAHYLMRVLPYRASNSAVDGVLVTFTDVTSIVASEEHQKALLAELNHRVKNTLTVVSSIASQTGASATSIEAFVETLLGRLHALAAAHDLLSQSQWTDASLKELTELELAPFVETGNCQLAASGPPVALKPRVAVTFGMVIHELATNSVKYGSLSAPEGRVEVSWAVEPRDSASALALRWLERDGPEVAPAGKRGFGIEFIERAARFELDGEAKIEFNRNGLRCRLTVPLSTDIVCLPT